MNSNFKEKLISIGLNVYSRLFSLRIMRYHYYRICEFVKEVAAEYDIEGKKLLDIGAGELPYKNYFSKISYYSHDLFQNRYNTIDYVGDVNIGLIDIESESFHYLLCTQVLEHLYNPWNSFKEFNRLLKPGGKLFLTTHMVFDEHMEPYDYFRFTKFGLKHLGESNGFTLEKIEPHGGVFYVLAYIYDTLPIKLFIKRDSVLYYAYLAICTPTLFVFNIIFGALDSLDKSKTFTINYECIYKKN